MKTHTLGAGQFRVHQPAQGMKLCERREHKLNKYVTIAVESQFKQLRSSQKKKNLFFFGLLRVLSNFHECYPHNFLETTKENFPCFHSVMVNGRFTTDKRSRTLKNHNDQACTVN